MAADACNPKRATIALACGLVVFFMVQSSARPEAHGGSNAHAQLLGEDGRLLQDVGSLSADRLAARYARYQQSKYSSEHKKPRVLTYRPDSAKSNAVLEDDYDVIMVGAGLSGGVLAERLARLAGAKVLLLDKRDHIGGNCYDYLDPDAHVLVNRYGAHLFHTDLAHVWEYITSLHPWERYDHQVLARVDGRLVPVPVNINSVNALLNLTIKTEREMDAWLKMTQVQPAHGGPPRNSKEMALSRVGTALYRKIFEPYTRKQWAKDPEELAPSVTARIPVRNNFDNRYFSDRFQALPVGGYTSFFNSMLAHPNVTTLLGVDFFDVRPRLSKRAKLFYTGPVDTYFASAGLGKLEYRSIRFVRELYRNHGYWQPVSVVNYPQDEKECGFADCSFTRIVEYKHYYGQTSPHTVTFREYSSDEGEPYYPVPSQRNVDLYAKFKALADAEKSVFFVGRLANYKYFNMDQAIDNALSIFEQTLCDVMPASAPCAAVRRGEHPAMWATKRASVPPTEGSGPQRSAAVGGGLVGGAQDKAMETAWRSPSDD